MASAEGAPKLEPKCTFVDFDGPDDPLHPYNWPVWKRSVEKRVKQERNKVN